MKKLITLTSILAAGTLCANAATTLTFEIPNVKATQNITGNVRLDDGTIADIQTFILGLSAGNYGGGNNRGAITNWSDLTDGTVTKNTDDYTITMLGRSGVSGEWFASVFVFDATNVSSGDYVSALTLNLTTSNAGAYGVLLFAQYEDGTTVASSERTSIATSTSGSVVLDLTETESSLSKVAFVIIGPSATAATAYNVTGVNFSATISEIPEPSFFGLMAGTLALGLAGTRRRRKTK